MSVSSRSLVMLACNDPATGPSRFESAEIALGWLEASMDGPLVRHRTRNQWLYVGRVRAWYFSESLCRPNINWGSWEIDADGIARIVNYLRSRGWRCGSSCKDFTRAWGKPDPITGEQLIAWGDGES